MNIHYFVPSLKDVITSIFLQADLVRTKVYLRKKWRDFGNEKELGQSVLLKELPLFKKKMLQNYCLYSRTARLDNLVL